LRAAVLGANDGIVSTASLVVGVAAANSSPSDILLTVVAGLVAGAMSMAAGEYVSVSSQSDTEKADFDRERHELATDAESELIELTQIYIKRGIAPELAKQVALQLTAHDAVRAHARVELGISHTMAARPIQAAFASAASFAVGAFLPLLVVLLVPKSWFILPEVCGSIVLLALLWIRGISRWRSSGKSRFASCFLGSACNGNNGWSRTFVWSVVVKLKRTATKIRSDSVIGMKPSAPHNAVIDTGPGISMCSGCARKSSEATWKIDLHILILALPFVVSHANQTEDPG